MKALRDWFIHYVFTYVHTLDIQWSENWYLITFEGGHTLRSLSHRHKVSFAINIHKDFAKKNSSSSHATCIKPSHTDSLIENLFHTVLFRIYMHGNRINPASRCLKRFTGNFKTFLGFCLLLKRLVANTARTWLTLMAIRHVKSLEILIRGQWHSWEFF